MGPPPPPLPSWNSEPLSATPSPRYTSWNFRMPVGGRRDGVNAWTPPRRRWVGWARVRGCSRPSDE